MQPRPLTPEESQRRRKRSIAIAAVLFALVTIFYVLTIAKARTSGPQPPNLTEPRRDGAP